MKLFKTIFIVSILVLILFSSCTSRKKMLYFRPTDNDSTSVFNSFEEEHVININDVLYINFNSFDKSVSEIFNREKGASSYSNWNSDANVYVNGFSVNNAGLVELPIIGKVSVVGKTVEKAKEEIQTAAKKYIKDVTVIVKLLNYRFTVIGEVTRPGTYTNYNNNLTIYQAISKAGDATIYGDKTQTLIVRETKEGKITIPVDLTSIDVLSSDVFYIKPNDIIYIKPIRNKAFKQNLPNIALIFSSISTIILVISFVGRY